MGQPSQAKPHVRRERIGVSPRPLFIVCDFPVDLSMEKSTHTSQIFHTDLLHHFHREHDNELRHRTNCTCPQTPNSFYVQIRCCARKKIDTNRLCPNAANHSVFPCYAPLISEAYLRQKQNST